MDRRLYVYYRVPQQALATTLEAVRTMHAMLIAAHPGLQAELLRRPELRDGEVTLMETYAAAAGISPAMQARIEHAAHALPQPRHTESFDLL